MSSFSLVLFTIGRVPTNYIQPNHFQADRAATTLFKVNTMVFEIFIMTIAAGVDRLPHGAVILTRLLTAPVSSGHTLQQASAVHLHKDKIISVQARTLCTICLWESKARRNPLGQKPHGSPAAHTGSPCQ
jgi:hypothetical protein